MIDSIDENLKLGKSALKAAINASKENFIPVLMTSLTTLAVFIPILFMTGFVGELFFDLSLSVMISQTISFVVAIFIIPSITCILYEFFGVKLNANNDKQKKKLTDLFSNIFVHKIISKPLYYWGVSILFIIIIIISLLFSPSTEFIPKREISSLKDIIYNISSSDYLDLFYKIENYLKKIKAHNRYIHKQENNIELDFEMTHNINKRELFLMSEEFKKYILPHNISLSWKNNLDKDAEFSKDIVFYIKMNIDDLKKMQNYLKNNINILNYKISGLENILFGEYNYTEAIVLGLPVMRYNILNIKVNSFSTIPIYSGLIRTEQNIVSSFGVIYNNFNIDKLYHQITNIFLPDNMNLIVSKINIKNIKNIFLNGEYVSEIYLSVINKTADDLLNEIINYAKNNKINLIWGEKQEKNKSNMLSLLHCFIIATIITLFILYMQNKSVTETITIMFTFFWGIIGALFGLIFHEETLNASAIIGFILLAGTIVNNGIMLMDIIIRQRKHQFSPIESAVIAVNQRTIPVLVTALTTVLGMFPMVLDKGEGSQMYRALSVVVVYGTTISTPISLVGIPCLVMIFSDLNEYIGKIKLKLFIKLERLKYAENN